MHKLPKKSITQHKNTSKNTLSRESNTRDEIQKLLLEGCTLQEIATQRNLTVQTIEGHLIDLYQNSQVSLQVVLNFTEFETLKIIKPYWSEDDTKLSDVKNALSDAGYTDISYFDIKLCKALLVKKDL